MELAQPGGGTDVAVKNLAAAACGKIANIRCRAARPDWVDPQVAQGKTDISATPFILNFDVRGLGPYSGLGKEKGKELAGNLRLLYPYHLAHSI